MIDEVNPSEPTEDAQTQSNIVPDAVSAIAPTEEMVASPLVEDLPLVSDVEDTSVLVTEVQTVTESMAAIFIRTACRLGW